MGAAAAAVVKHPSEYTVESIDAEIHFHYSKYTQMNFDFVVVFLFFRIFVVYFSIAIAFNCITINYNNSEKFVQLTRFSINNKLNNLVFHLYVFDFLCKLIGDERR